MKEAMKQSENDTSIRSEAESGCCGSCWFPLCLVTSAFFGTQARHKTSQQLQTHDANRWKFRPSA